MCCPECRKGNIAVACYDVEVVDQENEYKMMRMNSDLYLSIYRISNYYDYDLLIEQKDGSYCAKIWDPKAEFDFSRAEDESGDLCKSCNVVGEHRGMACICPRCNGVVWGC
jgi:hypothetical protein